MALRGVGRFSQPWLGWDWLALVGVGGRATPAHPLRCWQFRLKEPRIRTPSPMLGQAMFICVPSALWQWN
ncbi:hypothetical protein [Corynebacterium diphtheriae]|uniref:hypothetical protein n=1 Tax=Corynebacterium diphtheriae TaxID=1717 RepID=UPI0013FD950B|nr:hypothetical protein [Corynebacterium diphtheriae]